MFPRWKEAAWNKVALQVMDNEAFFFFFAFGEGGSNMDMVSSGGE